MPTTPIEAPWEPRRMAELLLAWFDGQHRDLPWRRTRDPYAILVSELMLQQTQVSAVVPYFERWMRKFPNWSALAKTPESEVLRAWEGLGYYQRARNLHRAADRVLREHGGELPADPVAIRALPGVGPYTSGAVASIAFSLREPLVDGNVMRVFARLANDRSPIDRTATQRKFWGWAAALVPAERPGDFNQALMELGATVCTPGRPACLVCPVRELCRAEEPAALPVKAGRIAITEREEWVEVFTNENGGIWMVPAQSGKKWQGLWRLPFCPADGARGRGVLAELRYSITRYRVTLRAVAADRDDPDERGEGRWVPSSELGHLAMPAPFRRLFLQLATSSNAAPP